MNVHIRILTPDPALALRRRIERRLRLRLGRWSNRLGRVSVRIEDRALLNGEPGKACSIRVQLLDSGMAIRWRTEDTDAIEAIEYAIERIARSVGRRLEEIGEVPAAREAGECGEPKVLR
jgi:ribosome-associated translation inhibitor RaiA